MPFCDNFKDFYIGLQEIVDESVSVNIREFTDDEYIYGITTMSIIQFT